MIALVTTERPEAAYEAPLVTDLGRMEDLTKGAGKGKVKEGMTPNKT
jgi:hypothetical protein